MRKPLSLKMRAIALLAQREHSLSELRTKLLRLARAAQALRQAQAGGPGDSDSSGETGDAPEPAEEVEGLLVWLQAQGYLSEARFVESRVHARAARYGNLRIKQELAQHGLSLSPERQAELKDSELARAQAIWQRKFGQLPDDAAARAKQTRFLAGRGFSAEVIRRVLRGEDD